MRETKESIIHVGLFALTIVYFEMVFRISIGESLLNIGTVYTALFSVVYGVIFYYITTIFKSKILNFVIRSIFVLILTLPYIVVYFLYCEFQILYDLNTAFAGAGDAIGSFSGDIISMICSVDGILHLILFLLPFMLYLIFGRKWNSLESGNKKERLIMLGILIIVALINGGLIYSDEQARNIFEDEYNYSSAVSEFGLITGIGLDVKNSVLGEEQELTFQTESTTATEGTTGEEEIVDTETKEEITGDNVLDIDFNALAEGSPEELADIDYYVASQEPSCKNEYTGMFEGKNLIFLSAEAFTAEAIDPELTPTLYRMATKGINFTDYYQPSSAGTTGGEYNNLMGMLPTAGGSSMKKTATHLNYMTIASRLSELGYYGKAYHNNDYTYYDRDKTHNNLGYSAGFEGVGNGLETCITSQWPESDLEMIEGTLDSYINKEHFNIYYMTVSGHSLYTPKQNAMTKKHWEQVKDLPYSDTVKSYLGAQLELEDAMTYLIDELEKAGIADDTVIYISADHFPYGLDQDSNSMKYLSELYGKSIDNELYRDHNRLIIWSGSLEKEEPIIVDTPTSSIDILPTLLNLYGVDYDSRLLPGRDVFSDAVPLVFNLGYDWKTDIGTYIAGSGKFIPKDDNVIVPEGYVEDVKATVKNKIIYCKGVLNQDYYRHVFGEE